MNSWPSFWYTGMELRTTSTEAAIVDFGWRSTKRHAGSYTAKSARLIGCFSSGW
jgi:hypothetical protein